MFPLLLFYYNIIYQYMYAFSVKKNGFMCVLQRTLT